MKLPTYDPLASQQATASDINQTREQLEHKPVVIAGRAYDCRPQDLLRMEAVGMANIDKPVVWTLADNRDITLKGADLLETRNRIIKELGHRMDQLHQIAQSLKTHDVSLRDIQPNQWIRKLNNH